MAIAPAIKQEPATTQFFFDLYNFFFEITSSDA
jgi:hypothetical protein